MGPPYEVSITYTEDMVRLAARRFLRLYVRRDSLLALAFILCARNGYSMLPVAKLTQDVRDFIIARVKATGGAVSAYE
jgi:hypothetical protein